MQERLRTQVITTSAPDLRIDTVAGLDVGYRGNDSVAGVCVVFDAKTLAILDEVVVEGTTDFPYIAGLFAFREMPVLLRALDQVTVAPDLLVADGQGLAHPRRFGLACHLGVHTGIPSIGVAKNPMGAFEQPGHARGSMNDLVMGGDDGDEVVGRALRTQDGVKPVFVSVGHKIDLDRACAEVLRLAPRYRLPETTRRADTLTRQVASSG
ncbi:endonuclease V [Lentzea flaviverrucosa]|uniref:Endonuclease V n=1 Tax=Lentzea flaviverrucosa TaxID=200379 RepID=A0A1H9XX01_9PSEU|nr:endonuclease V [Lentzea flaviverrucosa]RDI17451.1 endonuclease V [Lentzea flaviverrucosa]SES50681.1 Endonuclease V [Lentzea flaviverrucosa]